MADVPGANWTLGWSPLERRGMGEEENILGGIRPLFITEAEFRIVSMSFFSGIWAETETGMR